VLTQATVAVWNYVEQLDKSTSYRIYLCMNQSAYKPTPVTAGKISLNLVTMYKPRM